VENNSRALAYNNLMVDCQFGPRIAGGNDVTAKVYLADTTGPHNGDFIPMTAYGYNWNYVDNAAQAGQIVPTNVAQAVVTHPQSTDIPDMKTFLGAGYTFGQQYNGTPLVGLNNPQFVNYPLPNMNFQTQASVDGFDFHLKATSPALGKGYTGFTIPVNIPIDANFGATAAVKPGKDIGCYQADGSGNQH
jgi:hypothetical protein